MKCKITECGKDTTGNSKYCPEHALVAKQKWVEMIKAQEAERTEKYSKFAEALSEALEAGQKAFDACIPVPMVVEQHASVVDDNSPVVQSWYVGEGVCGFASVIIRPATSSFSHWLVKNGRGSNSSYHKGTFLSERPAKLSQSYERNCAWAHAVAEVLHRKLGIDVRVWSRVD